MFDRDVAPGRRRLGPACAAAAAVAIVAVLVAGSSTSARGPAPVRAARPAPVLAPPTTSVASPPAPAPSPVPDVPSSLPPVNPGGGLAVAPRRTDRPAVHVDIDPGRAAVDVAISPDGIPSVALAAYRRAAAAVDRAEPGCHLGWTLLAGIGRVESDHGRFGGALLLADGLSTIPVIGPPLDGVGTALIRDTDNGRLDGDRTFDRAVGPMQFIPSTWANWAADGDRDGQANPFDINDATLAAARYLCAAGGDLATRAGLVRAVLAYNSSRAYLREVIAYAAYYAGTAPIPLPPPPAPKPVHTSPVSTHSPAPSRTSAPSRPRTSTPAAPSSSTHPAAPSTSPPKSPTSRPVSTRPTSSAPSTARPTRTRASTPPTSRPPTSTSGTRTCRPTPTASGTGSTSSGKTSTSGSATASSSSAVSVSSSAGASGSSSPTGKTDRAPGSGSSTSSGACTTPSGSPTKQATTAAGVTTGLAGIAALGLVVLIGATVTRRRRDARQH